MTEILDYTKIAGPRPPYSTKDGSAQTEAHTRWDEGFFHYAEVMGLTLEAAREQWSCYAPETVLVPPPPPATRDDASLAFQLYGQAGKRRGDVASALGIPNAALAGFINGGRSAKCSREQALIMRDLITHDISVLRQSWDLFDLIARG